MRYSDIALKMAIRHPRVGEILSNPITDETEMELFKVYGLVYKRPLPLKDLKHYQFIHTAQMSELIKLYPIILQEGYRFTVGFHAIRLMSQDKEMPTKLLPLDQNKGGLMIDKINFDWYDHVVIYEKSAYSLDPERQINKQIKKNNDILDNYIINKRWFELLQL